MFAAWRLGDIIESGPGKSSDLSWALPGPTLLSICEIFIASLCATIPFFWPMLKQQLNKIFVVHEFSVSTESRFHPHDDDAVELAPTQSGNREKSTATEDVRSLGSKSAYHHTDEEHQIGRYGDDFFRSQADPFADDFRTETAIQSGVTGQKKGGFVRFKSST